MFQRVCMRTFAYLLVALSALATSGCARGTPPDTTGVAPELKLEGVRFRVYRGDTLHAFGTANTASLRRDSSQLRANDVEATLPRDGVPVVVTAPTGEGSLLS